MTREEMAQDIEHILVGVPIEDANARLAEIADELRKTCATCDKWTEVDPGVRWCNEYDEYMPPDGYCHRHEPRKETT